MKRHNTVTVTGFMSSSDFKDMRHKEVTCFCPETPTWCKSNCRGCHRVKITIEKLSTKRKGTNK